jgi:hypothetical protein
MNTRDSRNFARTSDPRTGPKADPELVADVAR